MKVKLCNSLFEVANMREQMFIHKGTNWHNWSGHFVRKTQVVDKCKIDNLTRPLVSVCSGNKSTQVGSLFCQDYGSTNFPAQILCVTQKTRKKHVDCREKIKMMDVFFLIHGIGELYWKWQLAPITQQKYVERRRIQNG